MRRRMEQEDGDEAYFDEDDDDDVPVPDMDQVEIGGFGDGRAMARVPTIGPREANGGGGTGVVGGECGSRQ